MGQVANLPFARQVGNLPHVAAEAAVPICREPAVRVPVEEPPTAPGRALVRAADRVEVIELAMAAPAGPMAGGGRLPAMDVSVIRQPTVVGTPEMVLPGGGVPNRWIRPDGAGGAGQGRGRAGER